MKLASLKHGRDGRLVVVSRDLSRSADASAVARTLRDALDDWAAAHPGAISMAGIHALKSRSRTTIEQAQAAQQKQAAKLNLEAQSRSSERDLLMLDLDQVESGKIPFITPVQVYTKSGDKWMSNGKAMDNASVQSLIDKLRDLSATKFVESGNITSAGSASEPVFDAAVTSNNGKRLEKVTIRKQGTRYFAQREGEPSIYELDSKSVEDLQKAAGDVKPAAPAPKK